MTGAGLGGAARTVPERTSRRMSLRMVEECGNTARFRHPFEEMRGDVGAQSRFRRKNWRNRVMSPHLLQQLAKSGLCPHISSTEGVLPSLADRHCAPGPDEEPQGDGGEGHEGQSAEGDAQVIARHLELVLGALAVFVGGK